MATVLFWNVNRKSLDGHVFRLVERHKVHVLILIERPEPDDTLLRALQASGKFAKVPSHDRFGVYSRYPQTAFTRILPPVSNERMDLWRLQPPGYAEILVGAIHGLDRINYQEGRRALFFERISEHVLWAENQIGHKRTVLLGDFNANPFEASIGGIRGLHAIQMSTVAGRPHRSVLGRDYEFFYNPMWNCFGRRANTAPGSHYFNGSDVHELFWHMLDQVVLRPELLPWFPENRLRILCEAGPDNLVTASGFPDRENASDHLPILFELKLRRSTAHD